MTPAPKPFYLSRTLWLNIAGLAVAILGGDYGVIPGVDPVLLAKVVTVFNLGLRVATSSAISLR